MDGIVLPRANGSGWFTTLREDRTYKTKKGAYQAQRMFEHPERWAGWKKNLEQTIIPESNIASESNSSTTEDIYYTYKDPLTDKKYIIKNDRTYKWDDLNTDWKRKINETTSDYKTKNELIDNGWIDVHLSNFFEDAQDKYPSCSWTFENIIKDLASEDDISEVVEEEE